MASWSPIQRWSDVDFLSTTDVGRLVPALAEKDAQSEASEWEFRERREREEERSVEAEKLGAEGDVRRTGVGYGGGLSFPLLLLPSFLAISLVHIISSWDRPGRRAKGSLQRAAFARTADGKRTLCTSP